ncbi:ABC transporter permease [Paraburkholderia sp. ZP32-5]|uniref:ABC transporter permease n=1 Tax=Paraburkholderia sp. ZP32-5 TaxID=2883245 RepID=UPI001F2F7FAE|nr:ABC transporter permease [Paraburkholderia sp. ZP32-5]
MTSSMLGRMGTWLGGIALSVLAWAIYIFLVVPSLLVIPMSFGGRDELTFPPTSFSFYLYGRFFDSPVWTGALSESLIVATLSACIATVLGTSAVYGLLRGKFRGQEVIAFVLMSPMLFPAIIVALGTYLYFAQLGLSGTTAGLVLAHSTLTLPFVMVTTAAGMRQIDPNVELAADTMGASRLRVFLKVVVPQIIPSIVSGALFAFLISFDEVVIAWFIAGTGATTLPVTMYSSLKMEVSPIIAASATMLSVASVSICVVSAMLRKPGHDAVAH